MDSPDTIPILPFVANLGCETINNQEPVLVQGLAYKHIPFTCGAITVRGHHNYTVSARLITG